MNTYQILSSLRDAGWWFKSLAEAAQFARENEDGLPLYAKDLFEEARDLSTEERMRSLEGSVTISLWLAGDRMDPFMPPGVDEEGFWVRSPEPLAELCRDASGAFSDSILTDSDDDGPVQVDVEMDQSWWEEQFSQDARLMTIPIDPETLQPGEPTFDLNWDHRTRAGQKRDECLQEVLGEIVSAETIGALKGLSGKLRFLAAQNTGIVKNCPVHITGGVAQKKKPTVRRFDPTLDFQRLAQARTEMVTRLLEIDPPRGTEEQVAALNRAMNSLTFTQGAKEEEDQARKVAGWVNGIMLRKYGMTQKGQPHFQVNPLGIYPPDPEKEGDDILDHCAREGEFMVDEEQVVGCPYCDGGLISDGEICPICGGFGEGKPSQFFEKVLSWKAEQDYLAREASLSRPRNLPVQLWKELPCEVPFEFRTKERTIYHRGDLIRVVTRHIKSGLSLPISQLISEDCVLRPGNQFPVGV